GLRPRLPQPHQLHRPQPPRIRRLQTPTTPSNAMSHKTFVTMTGCCRRVRKAATAGSSRTECGDEARATAPWPALMVRQEGVDRCVQGDLLCADYLQSPVLT